MKVFTGKVIKNNGQKTATVAVERVVVHPIYGKRFRRDRKYLVHDEFNVSVGETVVFADSKPYSKMKKWRIIKK